MAKAIGLKAEKTVVTFTSANPPTTPVAGFASEHVVGKRKAKVEPKPLPQSKNSQQAKSKTTNKSKVTGALLNKKKKK